MIQQENLIKEDRKKTINLNDSTNSINNLTNK
jgi:hypothetical protein